MARVPGRLTVRGIKGPGLALAGVTAAAATWFRPPHGLVELASRALGEDVWLFASVEEPVLGLSFDDGPHPATTPAILEVLERHGARATFFLVGERARRHPELVEAIAARGHELANHTWRVERSASLEAAELERSVARTQAELERVAPVTLMRPGSGWVNEGVRAAASKHGLRIVLGSIYPHDPLFVSRRYIRQFLLSRARPGGIVILHEGTPARVRTAEVLERVLPELRRRGLEATSVGDLLERQSSAVGSPKRA